MTTRTPAAAALLRPGPRRDRLVEQALLCAEAGDGAGPLLWRALGDVNAWAATVPPLRPFLFPPCEAALRWRALRAAEVDEPLRAPLSTFALLVDRAGAADAPRLYHACMRVMHWAVKRGAPRTASVFRSAALRITEEIEEAPRPPARTVRPPPRS